MLSFLIFFDGKKLTNNFAQTLHNKNNLMLLRYWIQVIMAFTHWFFIYKIKEIIYNFNCFERIPHKKKALVLEVFPKQEPTFKTGNWLNPYSQFVPKTTSKHSGTTTSPLSHWHRPKSRKFHSHQNPSCNFWWRSHKHL